MMPLTLARVSHGNSNNNRCAVVRVGIYLPINNTISSNNTYIYIIYIIIRRARIASVSCSIVQSACAGDRVGTIRHDGPKTPPPAPRQPSVGCICGPGRRSTRRRRRRRRSRRRRHRCGLLRPTTTTTSDCYSDRGLSLSV